MKLTGPMMSLDASGSIGGVLTAAKWKGRNYMRTLVTPSNPRSPGQTSTRAMMRFLSQAWADLGTTEQASWEDLAAQGQFSPFNAYVRENMRRWTQWSAPIQDATADGSDLPATITAFTGVAGVRQATLTIDWNAANQNWGGILYRSATNAFTPAKTDVVLVFPSPGTADTIVIDTPVEAGLWHYRVGSFSIEGVKATIFATEVDLTVT